MNGEKARKIRQIYRRDWRRTMAELKQMPFVFRWKIAWWLLKPGG